MELPRRARGDELLRPGGLKELRLRLRTISAKHDLSTVIACAFDHRTRMLPFTYADTRMSPAGVRAIGSAMLDSGFEKTRIVLQQWNRNFRPSQMRLDGKIPDLFMVSSMYIHSTPCHDLIRDAWKIDPAHRPLIIAGGPKIIYEPWGVFSNDPDNPYSADVAVTGEEYVLLNLLEVLTSIRVGNESMRSAFLRARDSGALDEIPGLVYSHGNRDGVAEELVDTGIQRLLGDLDELPDPVLGYQLLEPPSNLPTLGSHPLSAQQVHKHSPIGSLIMTLGCKFSCPYCPIPAYNQRQYRTKSGERISEEMGQLYRKYHIRFYFGADDNFFNNKARTFDIAEALARKVNTGARAHTKIRWATEATVRDTLKMKDHLSVVRKAGLMGLWMGVEDMSGNLVSKGQSVDETTKAFSLLRQNGIFPIPMMMHHDSQPLFTRKNQSGLLNQVHMLRKAGAIAIQIMMLTPSPGSKLYVDNYTSGLAYESINGHPVEPRFTDGNHVVASRHPKPWKKQCNLLLAYFCFYNPVRWLIALLFPKTKLFLTDTDIHPDAAKTLNRPRKGKFGQRVLRKLKVHLADSFVQAFRMWALAGLFRRTFIWNLRLMRGKIKRSSQVPGSQIPARGIDGQPASHALPGTPLAKSSSPEPKALEHNLT